MSVIKRFIYYLVLGLLLLSCGTATNSNNISATDSASNFINSTLPLNIIAHRGASLAAPENTLAAFNLAWLQGADEVEFDIHLSKDKRIMVIHDSTTGRTAGTDYIISKTNSDELRNLDVGRYKGPSFIGERIPYLEDVIATIPTGKKILIDIKTGIEILPFLQQIIMNSGKRDHIQIHTFSLSVAIQSKKMMPDLPTFYIVNTVTDVSQLVQTVIANGLDGISVEFHNATPQLIELTDSYKLRCLFFVVNEPGTAKLLIKNGIRNIITDDPELIHKIPDIYLKQATSY